MSRAPTVLLPRLLRFSPPPTQRRPHHERPHLAQRAPRRDHHSRGRAFGAPRGWGRVSDFGSYAMTVPAAARRFCPSCQAPYPEPSRYCRYTPLERPYQ